MDWFERLTGFKERGYGETRGQLVVHGSRIHSKVNGKSYATGLLETPAVKELRERARIGVDRLHGKLKVSFVSGDVRTMHGEPNNAQALFQVASQFNLLEMLGPSFTPEHGVTGYEGDPTQGPACAIAAGAATIFRNYFADVSGHAGQTRDIQIDCLQDLGVALGNDRDEHWTMCNGYALCTFEGVVAIERRIDASDVAEIDKLRDLLRIGLHWDVEVTDSAEPFPMVSQAFCSALPVSYSEIHDAPWRVFATLVLEGAYEATLWAAVLNAQRSASNIVYLTRLGGGAFGNNHDWIHSAMRRSLNLVRDIDLDVRIVSYGSASEDLMCLVQEF
jgi:hypothetical protein